MFRQSHDGCPSWATPPRQGAKPCTQLTPPDTPDPSPVLNFEYRTPKGCPKVELRNSNFEIRHSSFDLTQTLQFNHKGTKERQAQ
jgi:hypothetical protein